MSGFPFIPTVVAIVVALIGTSGSYARPYWIRGIGAVVVALAMHYLGQGGGTLEDPAGDGLVTRAIRKATDDGPLVAVWAIAMLVLGYGVIIVRIDRARLSMKWIWSGVRKDRRAGSA